MNHIERELIELREGVQDMWRLVLSQIEKAQQAFINNDVEIAREVISREKRVNAYELKIDHYCENYIALYAPVAIDLRLILSLIKISSTLERLGDFADGIARQVIEDECESVDQQLIENLKIDTMFDIVIAMLSDSYVTLDTENTKLSGRILAKDEEVDQIYKDAIDILTDYLATNTKDIRCGLKILLLMRKLERIGDHVSNIVEEIVFYIDAKVLKHQGKIGNIDDI